MIAILTDFGRSEYVGVMKGVIYSIYPKAIINDLYNHVNPQNIKEGAWILLQNYYFYPKGTIFLCVVDPGVGGKRNSIAIQTKKYYFVGPDNGLMYPATNKDGIKNVFILSNKGASSTFHGRDVFAKAAGMLEKISNIEKVGKQGKLKNKLNFYLKDRTGEIVRIDDFGNIITNLPTLEKNNYNITYKNKKLQLLFYKTYEAAKPNKLFLIKGSSNTLEISIKNNKAINKFKVNTGDKITIE